MQTSGHGNDRLMIVVPAGVALIVGVLLFGGPAEALEVVNELAREVVQLGLEIIHGLL